MTGKFVYYINREYMDQFKQVKRKLFESFDNYIRMGGEPDIKK